MKHVSSHFNIEEIQKENKYYTHHTRIFVPSIVTVSSEGEQPLQHLGSHAQQRQCWCCLLSLGHWPVGHQIIVEFLTLAHLININIDAH
jgi:hypothetical protein